MCALGTWSTSTPLDTLSIVLQPGPYPQSLTYHCWCAVAPPQGRGSGINFALPADMLRELVPNMALYGNAYGKK